MTPTRRMDMTMPQMGESLTEGTIVRWLKPVGAPVALDEPLCEISTDKVDTELPSPCAGIVAEIVAAEGQTVAIGAVLAWIETEAPAAAEPVTREPSPASVPDPATHFKNPAGDGTIVVRRRVASAAEPLPATRSYSPAVLGAAQRGEVPLEKLTQLQGSGRGGRVTKRDVEQFVQSGAGAQPQQAPPTGGADIEPPPDLLYRPGPRDRIVPMSPIQKQTARHVAWSVRISPHVTSFAECDLSRAAEWIARSRESFKADTGAPLTYTTIVAYAAIRALRHVPSLNASVVGDSLVLKPYVNLGIAVALTDTDELIVPVVQNAHELSFIGLARAIQDLGARARARTLQADDVRGGTFTLTNPGMFGGSAGTPLIVQPQVAILGLSAAAKRAAVVDDSLAVRPMMTFGLSHDHRAANGMTAFRYLEALRIEVERLDFAGA